MLYHFRGTQKVRLDMRLAQRFFLLCGTFLALGISASAAGVLWQNDFESAGGNITSGTAVTYSRVANPSGAGTSLLLTDTGNSNAWGAEISPPNGRVFAFSDYGAVAGVDKITYSYDIFIPTDTVAVGDLLYMFSRVLTDTGTDGNGATERLASINLGNLAKGQWHTITGELLMPATANNNGGGSGTSPSTRVAVFLSYNDAGTVNAAGRLAYLDNIHVGITPEPSKLFLVSLGIGMLFLRRRRCV